MVHIKPLLIKGDIVSRVLDNKKKARISTLCENIEEALTDFDEGKIVDVNVGNVDYPTGANGGSALLLLKYESDKPIARKKKK